MALKTPTNRERIDTYENVFNDLHFHTHVTHNNEAVSKIMKRIWAFCEAQKSANTNEAFWNLNEHK